MATELEEHIFTESTSSVRPRNGRRVLLGRQSKSSFVSFHLKTPGVLARAVGELLQTFGKCNRRPAVRVKLPRQDHAGTQETNAGTGLRANGMQGDPCSRPCC